MPKTQRDIYVPICVNGTVFRFKKNLKTAARKTCIEALLCVVFTSILVLNV